MYLFLQPAMKNLHDLMLWWDEWGKEKVDRIDVIKK